jgi:retinol-binding protein 3
VSEQISFRIIIFIFLPLLIMYQGLPVRMKRSFFITLCLLFNICFFGQSVKGFPLNNGAIKVLVDSLSSQIKRYYVDKEAAEKMSVALTQKLKAGAYKDVRDPHMLAALLTKDVLAAHKDEHFHVEYYPSMVAELTGNIDDVPKLVADRLKQDQYRNFGFRKAEILPGNIGYLELSGFSRLNKYSKEAADVALKFFRNSRALIIDLRYGIGGSPDMLTYIAGHFFKEKTHISDIYIRSENVSLPYWTQPDSSNGRLTEIPLYIITSYKTFSAAEGLAYALQQLKRATIIGETTRGGAHTVTYRPLSSGFVSDIPFGRAVSPVTKTNWEGTGIKPDVQVPADIAPETAQLKIIDDAIAKADSAERYSLRWSRILLQAQHHPFASDTAFNRKCEGTYGAYQISVSNGVTYYQKTGKAKFPLVPISEHVMRPLGIESFVVEFITGPAGRPMAIITRYDDGRSETAVRTN